MGIVPGTGGYSHSSSTGKRGRFENGHHSSDTRRKMARDSDGIVVATRPLHTKKPSNCETQYVHSTELADLEKSGNIGSAESSHHFDGNNMSIHFTLPNVPETSTCNCILSQLLYAAKNQALGIETRFLGQFDYCAHNRWM